MAQGSIVRRGGGIDLQVIAVTSTLLLPAVAPDNTLAVITDVPVGAVVVTPVLPDAAGYEAGNVVIEISDRSTAPIILKGDPMTYEMYALAAYQHDGATWARVEAYGPVEGAWVELDANMYLYNRGIVSPKAGEMIALPNTNPNGATITYKGDSVFFNFGSAADGHQALYFTNKIDTTKYKRLSVAYIMSVVAGYSSTLPLTIGLMATIPTCGVAQSGTWIAKAINGSSVATQRTTLDISAINGIYYIVFAGVGMRGDMCEIVLYRD